MATLTPDTAARWARLTRSNLYFWLLLLLALNSFAGLAIRIVPEHGLAYAIFELFGISAIVWTAFAAALALLRNQADISVPTRADWWVAGIAALVALVPVANASSIGLTFLALHMIFTSPRGAGTRKAGVIALAMTGSLIWGRLILALFSGPLLGIDSWLVARLAGVHQAANTLVMADGSGGIVVAPGCSSWQGMSLALVFWVTVNQWFAVPLSWRSILWCVAALAATVAVNILRISAMVHFPDHLSEIHHGYGWHLSMWTTLIAVVAICVYGARREIFDS